MPYTPPRRPLRAMPAVGSVMTPCPQRVDVNDSLLFARALMQRHEVRHLPVMRGATVVGVLTDRDVKRALDPDLGLPPSDELFVDDICVADAYVVDLEEPLDRVLDHMASQHIGSALVAENGQLVGIFTATDACRAFCGFLRETVAADALP